MVAMLTLRTWMDDTGYAFPGIRTWAKAARISPTTLLKQLELAVGLGWLGVEHWKKTKAWRQNVYRAAVPDNIQLSEKDLALAQALVADYGEIGAACNDLGVTPRVVQQQPAVTPRVVQQGRAYSDGVPSGDEMLCQEPPLAVPKNGLAVPNQGGFGVPELAVSKFFSESSRSSELPHTQGAAARPGVCDLKTVQRAEPDPEQQRMAAKEKAAKAAAARSNRIEEAVRKFSRLYEGDDDSLAKMVSPPMTRSELAEARSRVGEDARRQQA
jgi:hypothetical protein